MIDELIELFNEGLLSEAIEKGNRHVADNPRDMVSRLLLLQFVCFTGHWDRVERIVKQLATLDASDEYAPLTNFVSKLAAAERKREAVWNHGQLPQFMTQPEELQKKALWAINCRREEQLEKYEESMDWILDNAPEHQVETVSYTHLTLPTKA